MKRKFFLFVFIVNFILINNLYSYIPPPEGLSNIADEDNFSGIVWIDNNYVNTNDVNTHDLNNSQPIQETSNQSSSQLAQQNQTMKNIQEEIKIQQELQTQTLKKLNEVEKRSNTLLLVVIFLGLILAAIIVVIFFKLFRGSAY